MGATYIRNYISKEKVWECGNNITIKQTNTHTHTPNFKPSSVSIYVVSTRYEGELKVNSFSELKSKRTTIKRFHVTITIKYWRALVEIPSFSSKQLKSQLLEMAS
jgi:hypothetical protein